MQELGQLMYCVKKKYSAIQNFSIPVGARLNKFLHTSTRNLSTLWETICGHGFFSYVDIRIYFQLPCNYMQTKPSCTDPPTYPPPNSTHTPKKINIKNIIFNWTEIPT
jgi:hypothetical protein